MTSAAMDSASSPPLPPPTPSRRDEQDPKASLRHILASDPISAPSSPAPTEPALPALPSLASKESRDGQATPAASDSAPHNDNTSITTSLRRNQSGTVSSVVSGNRVINLKKDDGQPFLRRDIQYLFLRYVFEDQTRVFTKFSDKTPNHTFAEIYVDAMAQSRKCSKLLKEKLLSEVMDGATVPPAIEMAMVCLLVNVGRMNTTVNFCPDMRARVRTFHSIPCLQTHQGPMAYKQLQDGPRLKSILKGALEGEEQPKTFPELLITPKPRLNPVSLTFMLAQYAPKISDQHFPPSRDFFDLFMRETLSSKSRAIGFLWLLWWYLESDFTQEDTQSNPFGPGQPTAEGELSVRIPPFETITEEEAAKENEDLQDELDYAEVKRKERDVVLALDNPPVSSANDDAALSNGGILGKSGTSKPSSAALETLRAKVEGAGRKAELKRVLEAREDMQYSGDLSSGPTTPIPHFKAVNMPRSLRTGDTGYSNRCPSSPGERHKPDLPHSRSGDSADNSVYDDRDRRLPPRSGEIYPQRDASEDQRGFDETNSTPGHPKLTTYTPGSRPQYQHAGSPYAPGSGYFSATNGIGKEDSENGHDRGISPRAGSRPASGHPATAQQIRAEKAAALVKSNLRDIQNGKLRERKRRGLIVDAWIKARSIRDGWDSEDDEFGRTGSIDDVSPSTGIPVTMKSRDGHETKVTAWNIGDAGKRVGELANGLGRLVQILKKQEAKVSKQQQPNGGKKRKAETKVVDEEAYWRLPSSKYASKIQAPAPPLFTQPFAPPPAPSARSGPAALPYVTEEENHHAPPEKKRRRARGGKTAPPAEAQSAEQTNDLPPSRKTSSGGAAGTQFNWVPKGRKRKDSDTNATPDLLRPGEMGIPRDVFFSPTIGGRLVETAATASGAPRRRRTKSGAGVERSEFGATAESGRRASEVDVEGDVNMDLPPDAPLGRDESQRENGDSRDGGRLADAVMTE